MADKPSMTLIQPSAAQILDSPIAKAGLDPVNLKWLESATFTHHDDSLERLLLRQFVQLDNNSADLPMAALRQPQQAAICADPCYLHPDQTRLRLFAQPVNLSLSEAEALVDSLQSLFADHNAVLSIESAMHWTLSLPELPQLECQALPDMEGRAVDPMTMLNGQDKAQWLSLWNSVQMTLFEHPVNQQREAAGQLPVNSLWFWGLGRTDFHPSPWRCVYGNQSLLGQLAKQAGVQHQTDLWSLQQWSSMPAGKYLWLADELDQDVTKAIDQLNKQLSEMRRQLRARQISELIWLIPHYGCYRFAARQWWQIWR